MAESELRELQNIKLLLVALLLKLGASSEEVGLALGVDSSLVRKMLPVRKLKRIKFTP